MENVMVTVPLNDFMEGVSARSTLENIKSLVEKSGAYCSDEIRVILGLSSKRGNSNGTN